MCFVSSLYEYKYLSFVWHLRNIFSLHSIIAGNKNYLCYLWLKIIEFTILVQNS